MPLAAPLLADLRDAGLDAEVDAPLARRAWWRVGGPADGLVRVETLDQLVAVQRLAHRHTTPVFVLGNGSNILISDRGVRGLVVVLAGALADSEVLDPGPPARLRLGGGLKLTVLLARAERQGWAGLACFAGIPGTVGGAVRMNAGANLGETSDVLRAVTAVLASGEVAHLPAEGLAMAYRTCALPPGAIVAFAEVEGAPVDADEERARMRAFLDKRKATQPLDLPSCGSTFRNPPGDFAGRLIEAAGLKGHRVGGAQISPKHANFVVNLGDATAADIAAVIAHAQAEVAARFGVSLEREVHLVGDWG